MGSTTPPPDQQNKHSDIPSELTTSELRKLLEQRDQEIRLLKFELEKYKLALRQSQERQQQQADDKRAHVSGESLLGVVASAAQNQDDLIPSVSGTLASASGPASAPRPPIDDDSEKIVVRKHAASAGDIQSNPSLSKEITSHILAKGPGARHSIESAAASIAVTSATTTTTGRGRVIFKTGHDDDVDDEEDQKTRNLEKGDGGEERKEARDEIDTQDKQHMSIVDDITADVEDEDDDIEEIIQDVGEIDFNVEFEKPGEAATTMPATTKYTKLDKSDKDDGANSNQENGGDDIISQGLLTSLTDAAISNLSQLAALQERCESQQQPQPYHQGSESRQPPVSRSQQQQIQVSATDLYVCQAGSPAIAPDIPASARALAPRAVGTRGVQAPTSTTILDEEQQLKSEGHFSIQDPFSASNLANQAALAISAAASMQTPPDLTRSSSSSTSQNSTIQPDLSTSQTLANVVAAAAAAAAAAATNDQQQYHDPTHQLQSADQTRLISSALSSPEFYHNLQQHQRNQQQASTHHHMTSISPHLHFGPSTSMTPSPTSYIGHSRRSGSNTSSSFMSPIASPNYLRRQFMPDKLPLMSPSPSSMTTGSSSAASSSLAHILQQHQQSYHQRSVSALAGPITSPSSTPLSSTGSTAVSPLIGSKSSSQLRLNNMQIRHKFGYLGSGRGQFNSPHGFCLGLNQEIVVADTNNHRVCIFDKSGTYITQFGSPGKEEGQLWNPRKVAILHRPQSGSASSGTGVAAIQAAPQPQQRHQQQQLSSYSSHFTSAGGIQSTSSASSASLFGSDPLYVVCDRGAERSRMQLFTKDGVFIKKIGIHYIDIVAGLAITQNGLIIVVDSVSPTVYIINAETGTLNGWFDCSGHMKEPSDIAVKSDLPANEYFICDFKGHCVVVFSEQGEYLRKIGQDGLTSYPNGIDISDDGDILVGDSHGNRFHVVVFDRNGNFVSQFECPHVKVSRCCGLKITREGYIVTLAKNNHHVLVLDTIHI